MEYTYGMGICPSCDGLAKLVKTTGLIAYHAIESAGKCSGVGQEPVESELSNEDKLIKDYDAYYY